LLIIQGKKAIDRLEDLDRRYQGKKQQDRDDLDTIVAELEKYGKEIALIKCVIELETKLDEAKQTG
jgi:hypothetical protein